MKVVEINIGQEHRYEDYSYVIERLDDGNLSLRITKLHNEKPSVVTFIFPENMDISKLYNIVSYPTNQGWEKVFGEIYARYEQL